MEKIAPDAFAHMADQLELSVIDLTMKDTLGAKFTEGNGLVVVTDEDDSVNGSSKRLNVWGSPFSEISGTSNEQRIFSVLPDSTVHTKDGFTQREASPEECEIVDFLLQSMLGKQRERERMGQRIIGLFQ